jgi:peptidoglycan/LPS O-acetylase OafA/YrhL
MQQRISSLDTLRGVAILMVIVGHYLPAGALSRSVAWHVTSLGRGGVILFFLLSGYLIYWNVQVHTPAVFLSRRFFKICPAYCVSVLAIFTSALFVGPKWTVAALLSNLTMTQDLLGEPLLTGVYWTLLIEVKFYLLIAVLYFLFHDRLTVAVPLTMIAVNLVILIARGQASLLLTFLPAFYVGIQIRRLQCGAPARGLVIVAIGVAASLITCDPYYGGWSCFYLLAAAPALWLCVNQEAGQSMLSFFGRISYSLYLYHAAVAALIFPIFAIHPIVGIMIASAVSTVVALSSYELVELRFVAFGKAHERFWLSEPKEKSVDVLVP